MPALLLMPRGLPPQFAPISLYIFDEASPIRHICVWFSQWKWFDRFILAVIVFNSVLLALEDYSSGAVDPHTYTPDPSKSARNRLVDACDTPLIVIFTIECVVKIVAMGFFVDDGSYLRNSWNWLDFVVVVSGYVPRRWQTARLILTDTWLVCVF